ncbi:MAG TPA: DUF262 domain-containing protein [Geminicoccaceae bacterium]|nr:DUF262 domain-containing protein [Geminicoccaceae bacterium]
MAVNPTGRSIQTLYRQYRAGQLIVNRKYQRKLVWTTDEKKELIRSIINDFPIPQFILARIGQKHLRSETSISDDDVFEIIDGVQRLNAIFGFIDGEFAVDGRIFDYNQLPRAKQAFDEKEIRPISTITDSMMDQNTCARITDYQLAVTTFDAHNEQQVTAIFGCINTGGRQLSEQDRRQAGSVSRFSELVRRISASIRGDETTTSIDLRFMPSISIDVPNASSGYAIKAEDVFWCRQGVARHQELRQSVDEQIVADLLASTLLKEPIKNEKADIDSLYDAESAISSKILSALAQYRDEEIIERFVYIIGLVEQIVATHPSAKSFRSIVNRQGQSNPMRLTFHAFSVRYMI